MANGTGKVNKNGKTLLRLPFNLSFDLLEIILQFSMTGVRDLQVAGLVSKLFNRVTHSPLLRRCFISLDLSDSNHITGDDLAAAAKWLPYLKILDVSGSPCITGNAMAAAANLLPNLIRLNMDGYRFATDDNMATIVHNLPHLLELFLSCNYDITATGIRIIGQLSLTRLGLSGCNQVTDAIVKVLTQCDGLQGLINLDLSGCYLITDSSVLYIMSSLQTLKVLCLDRCLQITNRGMDSIANLCPGQLTSLGLGDCRRITGLGVRVVVNRQRNLKYLNLSGCHEITERDVAGILNGQERGLHIEQ